METPRWKQRLENFEKAYVLLQDAFRNDISTLSDLEKEGVIQRFEYTFELAWKTLKDYLTHSGILLEQITPRSVIKAAFAAKIIQNGQLWIDMLKRRNLMSHVYERDTFEATIERIGAAYLDAFDQVFTLLKEKSIEE
ncbi:MAG: nucleotidyltransferase substrate binding protein [Myxococcota bacterium]|nr:nucleotidyltransferase substrate binding protein [Myxococcota bacterium]